MHLFRAGIARTEAMSKEQDIALELLFSDVLKNVKIRSVFKSVFRIDIIRR